MLRCQNTMHPVFSSYNVNCVAIDKADQAWVGTAEDGLLKYDGAAWTLYMQDDGLPGNREVTVAIDDNNILWAGAWEGGVSSFDGETWTKYETADGLPENISSTGVKYAYGKIWIFTDYSPLTGFLAYFDDGNWHIKYTQVGGIGIIAQETSNSQSVLTDEFWYWTEWNGEPHGFTGCMMV